MTEYDFSKGKRGAVLPSAPPRRETEMAEQETQNLTATELLAAAEVDVERDDALRTVRRFKAACSAMQGLLASRGGGLLAWPPARESIISESVLLADALLEALDREESG